MKTAERTHIIPELDHLCATVRTLVAERAYERCVALICDAMEQHPHAPHPHNLMGIVLEKRGDHPAAMKHFRAAWALDPTYGPARQNLETYGTFYSRGRCAYDESDLPDLPQHTMEVVYNDRGVGYVVSKTKIEYDHHGIGHVVRR